MKNKKCQILNNYAMKKVYTKFPSLLLLMIPMLWIMGCEDDNELSNETSEPSIVFTTTRASLNPIRLDDGTGPNIRGWAVAPEGLAQVLITAEVGGSTVTLFDMTSFNAENSEKNGTAYNFSVYPEYTSEFTGITVTVKDKKNETAEIALEIVANGGTSGPKLENFPASLKANINEEVNIRPDVTGTVSSHWGIKSVSYIEIYGDSETSVETITDFGDTPNQHAVNISPDYESGYADGLTGYKIVATDMRDYSNEVVVEISIIDAPPAPFIEADVESIEADLTSTPQVAPAVSGSIISFEGLVSVTFYVVMGDVDDQFEEFTSFDDPTEFDFSVDPPYGLGVTGVKIVAVDINDQSTTVVIPASVKAEDNDLLVWNNVELSCQGDRFTQNTIFASRNGSTYHYEEPVGNEELAKTIDFLWADTGGSNTYSIFSPLGDAWLANNFYKGVEWPYYNTTKLRHLSDKDQAYFNAASSVTISNLEMGEDYVLRQNGLLPGAVVFFETEEGKKGLVYLKSVVNDTPETENKNDDVTIDVKVLK